MRWRNDLYLKDKRIDWTLTEHKLCLSKERINSDILENFSSGRKKPLITQISSKTNVFFNEHSTRKLASKTFLEEASVHESRYPKKCYCWNVKSFYLMYSKKSHLAESTLMTTRILIYHFAAPKKQITWKLLELSAAVRSRIGERHSYSFMCGRVSITWLLAYVIGLTFA